MKKSELIKLTKQILQEIRVAVPLTKRKVFEDMLKLDESLLYELVYFDKLEDLIDEYGYDSLEDLLINKFGINNPQPYTTAITNYFNVIEPEDIIIIGYGITSITGYKNATSLTKDNGIKHSDKVYIALKF
jgi:hypothetical protein